MVEKFEELRKERLEQKPVEEEEEGDIGEKKATTINHHAQVDYGHDKGFA